MLFSTQPFLLIFLPLTLLCFWCVSEHQRLRQSVLILSSLIFYGLWNWRYVPALILLSAINWWCGQKHATGGSKLWPVSCIILDLAILAFCKYANFFAATADDLIGAHHTPWEIILPLGLSFFVFQKISYLADTIKGDKTRYGFPEFLEFVTFFPQLIAGPIVRHNEIIPQFREKLSATLMWENIGRGLVLLIIGLCKKSAIADSMGSIVTPLYDQAASGVMLTAAQAWLAATAYTLQIYFDFSGYSDMAIGMALMFGLKLPFNFNKPYCSTSISEFWRRWHMTLSRFLRDYIYIPLGGNRHGMGRQCCNLLITMGLGGLWHGAGWTFIAWGGMHGSALAIGHLWKLLDRPLPKLLGWFLTIIFVIVAWVFFRAPDFRTAANVLTAMTGLHGIGHQHIRDAIIFWGAIVIALVGPASQTVALQKLKPSPIYAIIAALALVALIFLIGGRIPDPFIYFQF